MPTRIYSLRLLAGLDGARFRATMARSDTLPQTISQDFSPDKRAERGCCTSELPLTATTGSPATFHSFRSNSSRRSTSS